MIYDFFEKSHRYSEIPCLKEIERFVAEKHFPVGEHEILGRDLFVRIAEYFTGPDEEKQFEAHQTYADLQLVVEGEESMGYSLAAHPKPVTSYDTQADICFFESPRENSSVIVSAGQFTVFFPGELHRPGCFVNQTSAKVKKLVFKIKMAPVAQIALT